MDNDDDNDNYVDNDIIIIINGTLVLSFYCNIEIRAQKATTLDRSRPYI